MKDKILLFLVSLLIFFGLRTKALKRKAKSLKAENDALKVGNEIEEEIETASKKHKKEEAKRLEENTGDDWYDPENGI